MSTIHENVQSALCFLTQTIALKKSILSSGTECLRLSSKLLRHVAALHDKVYHGLASDDEISDPRRLTGTTEDHEPSPRSAEDFTRARELLDLCGLVSGLEIDGKDDRHARVFDFTPFHRLRKLVLLSCNIRRISGVQHVAFLNLDNTSGENIIDSFHTLRVLEADDTALTSRALTVVAYSLRRIKFYIVSRTTVTPHFLPTSHANRFDRTSFDVDLWESLTWLAFSRKKQDFAVPLSPGSQLLRLDASLQYLKNLQRVDLCHLQLKALDGLASLRLCTSIKIIDLSYNCIESITISALPLLVRELHLQFNQIGDVALKELEGLKELCCLDVRDNNICEWATLRCLPLTLTTVAFRGNPICAVSSLLYRDDDEYCAFLRSTVLRHCEHLSMVDGLTVKAKHLRPKDSEFVRRLETSMTALRGRPNIEHSDSQVTSVDRTRAPNVALQEDQRRPAETLRGALKPQKRRAGKSRRKVRHISDTLEGFALPDEPTEEFNIRESRAMQAQALRRQLPNNYLEHIPPPVPLLDPSTSTPAPNRNPPPVAVGSSAQNYDRPDELDRKKVDSVARFNATFSGLRVSAPPEQVSILLERFLKSLHEIEWDATYNGRRIFSGGLTFDHTQISQENAVLWEVAVPGHEASKRFRCGIHDKAREILLRDLRVEPQLQDHARFKNKSLIRVVETHSGTFRYLKIETKMADGSFSARRPSFVLVMGQANETATKDVSVTACRTGDVSELGQEVGHVLHEVSLPGLLAAFVLPSAAEKIFVSALREQCMLCLGPLVANGIVRQWPKHFDGPRHRSSEDLSHAIPVRDGRQLFVDQLKVHESADPARQRHGCECIFQKNDELTVHLQCQVFNEATDFTCVVYSYIQIAGGAQKSAVGMDVANSHGGYDGVLCFSPNYLFIAEDRNFKGAHPGAKYVAEPETFRRTEKIKLTDLLSMGVSFDGQQFLLEFPSRTLVCSPLDRSVTLCVAGALQQCGHLEGTRSTSVHQLHFYPCPYPFLTTAPLVFGMSVYFYHPALSNLQQPPADPKRFPLRHLESAMASKMVLVSFVLTSTEIFIVIVVNPFVDATHPPGQQRKENSQVLQKAPLGSILSIDVVSGETMFPLIFSASFRSVDNGREWSWLFCAPHPATISCIVRQLRSGNNRLRTGLLPVSRYRSLVDGSEQMPSEH